MCMAREKSNPVKRILAVRARCGLDQGLDSCNPALIFYHHADVMQFVDLGA